MAQRIVEQPKKVLDRSAPYWRGERAEDIVKARVEERKQAKTTRRRSGSQPRGRRSSSPASPNKELRRLERALKRRKTLAARQRVSARIKQLKQELGL
jgi:hypothetical protein